MLIPGVPLLIPMLFTRKGNMNVFLIAGPSGSGKTSLAKGLVLANPNIRKVVTVTTRAPRDGEINGVDYHFVTIERFFDMKRHGLFLEVDGAYNECYGTLQSSFHTPSDFHTVKALTAIVTVTGAMSLRKALSARFTTKNVFVLPPDPETAAKRVLSRHAANSESRISGFEQEVDAAFGDDDFDTVIVNRDFNSALDKLTQFVEESINDVTGDTLRFTNSGGFG